MPKPPVSQPRSSAVSSRTESLGEFRNAVSNWFVPLQVTSTSTSTHSFNAQLSTVDADGVAFTEVAASPHVVERTPETICRGGGGYYKVSLLLAGQSVLVQDGREVIMRPGDLTVYDTSRPYSLLFTEEFRNLIMMFPKDRLNIPVPFTEQLTAVSMREQSDLAPVVASFLSEFPTQLAKLPERVRSKLGNTSLDLVGTLFSQVLDVGAPAQDPHRQLLQKIHTFIEDRLGSSDLSPTFIAEAHYISTRHLHSLFREVDTTVSTWIRERRLERCRADLLNPLFADRTISSVAARWGFVDGAHFSRLFKSTYGVAPSDLRHR